MIKSEEKKSEESLRDLWGNIKQTNIYIMRVLEGEERETGSESLFEGLMAEIWGRKWTPKLKKMKGLQLR